MERVEYDQFAVDGKIVRPPFAKTCEECEGTGEVHSHNPKCYDCCGFGWVLPNNLRLHGDTLDALDHIDAAIFSGDSLVVATTHKVMVYYLERWMRELNSLRDKLHPVDDGLTLEIPCFVCGAKVGEVCRTKNGTAGKDVAHSTRLKDDDG